MVLEGRMEQTRCSKPSNTLQKLSYCCSWPQSSLPKCVSQSHVVQYRANRCGSCGCLLQVVHWRHKAQDALRLCPHQNQVQQWGGSGLSSVNVWIFSCRWPCTPVSSGGTLHTLRLRRQTFCLPGRLVPVDQTAVTTDNRCYHSSHQISQPCLTVHQDTSVERLLLGPHST